MFHSLNINAILKTFLTFKNLIVIDKPTRRWSPPKLPDEANDSCIIDMPMQGIQKQGDFTAAEIKFPASAQSSLNYPCLYPVEMS